MIAVLADSSATSPKHLKELQDAARARGIALSIFAVSKPEIGSAMRMVTRPASWRFQNV